MRKHEIDSGLRDGVTSEERECIKALAREVKALRRANEMPKLASAFFAQAELDNAAGIGSQNDGLRSRSWPGKHTRHGSRVRCQSKHPENDVRHAR